MIPRLVRIAATFGSISLFGLLMANEAAASTVRVAGPLDELRAAHPLVLVCHDPSGEVLAVIMPYLEALAETYAAHGLAVAVTGPGQGAENLLALWREDSQPLLAQDERSLDLWAVYRTCERHLRGRRTGTFAAHVAEVLGSLVDADERARGFRDGRRRPVAELLGAGEVAYLLLPPGCNQCQLNRHEAALQQLQDLRPGLPALCFDPDAAAVLAEAGWSGDTYILPLQAPARLLSLRQAGPYGPVVVVAGAQGVSVRSLREEVDAWQGR